MRVEVKQAHRAGASEPISNGWRNPALAGRIRQLDGLRGLAVSMIVVQHYVSQASSPPLSVALRRLQLFSGVDLFFVLSGFLIGGILLESKDRSNYFGTFYARRVARIMPPYLLLLSVYVCAQILPVTRSSSVFGSQAPVWSYLTFTQNIVGAAQNTGDASWMGPSWSLAIEEQFYLLTPLLIRFASRRTAIRVIAGAVLAAPLFRVSCELTHHLQAARLLLPCRTDGLGVGILIAAAVRDERIWSWLSRHKAALYWCTGSLLLWTLVAESGQGVLGYTLFALAYGGVLLTLILAPHPWTLRVFRSRFLVVAGTISYFLYLFHYGINIVVHKAVLNSGPRFTNPKSIAVTLLSLAITVALAKVSWRLIEHRLLERARSRYRYGTRQPAALHSSA